jgi:hypothetical protein
VRLQNRSWVLRDLSRQAVASARRITVVRRHINELEAGIASPLGDELVRVAPHRGDDLYLIPDAMVGAIGAYPDGSGHDFELGIFAPRCGVPEDPVCWSMNASVGQWLTATDGVPLRQCRRRVRSPVRQRHDVRMLTLFGVPKVPHTTRKSGLVAAGGSCDREVREAE